MRVGALKASPARRAEAGHPASGRDRSLCWPHGLPSLQICGICPNIVALSNDSITAMVQITLPDGSRKDFDHPVTVHDVAASIGPGLARAALGGEVDGRLVDTSFRIDGNADLRIITAR